MEIPASELSCLAFSFTSGGTVSLIVTLRLPLMSLRPALSLAAPIRLVCFFIPIVYFCTENPKGGGNFPSRAY